MLYRLTHFFDEAAKDVPAVLWSPSAVARMKSVVERFPQVRSRTIGSARLGVFGLEFRLAADAEQVDLTFPILGEDREVIVSLGKDSSEGGWLHEDPYWARVWRFCCRWAEPEGLLGQNVELLWFELDVDGKAGGEGLQAPGIFVRFKPETTARSSVETWRQILSEALSLLGGREPQPALLERFELCLRSLPVGAFVQYVGLMLARGGDTVRFVFGNLTEPDVPAFLEAADWPGRAGDLSSTLREVTRLNGEVLHRGAGTLQLDVGPHGVLPRIGLEYALDRSAQVEEGIGERRFLERLVERNLCSAEKLAALLALPSRTLVVWQDFCLVGHARHVHHVKLVIDAGGISEAKAYYGQALSIRRIEDDPSAPDGASPEGTAPFT